MTASRYIPFQTLTDEELTNALNKVEAALVGYASSQGQRTVSIGGVSFQYGTLDQLLKIRSLLIAAYDARAEGPAKFAPYRITHLMR